MNNSEAAFSFNSDAFLFQIKKTVSQSVSSSVGRPLNVLRTLRRVDFSILTIEEHVESLENIRISKNFHYKDILFRGAIKMP